MMEKRVITSSTSVAAIALLIATGSAHAQEATVPNQDAPAAPQASAGGLEDIVVTARKRAESAQDVPISVVAIAPEAIVQRDLTSIEKIAAATPSFTVGRASTGSGAQLTMRGIGSSASSIGIEQSVATVVDGVYYGQGRVINEGFFDLERVEILKGPQALYFGKNATAGLISLTTADPGSTTEIRAGLAYEFKSEQIQGELVASTPLTDTLGVRIAVRGSKMYGGYYTNISRPVPFAFTDHVSLPADREAPGEEEAIGRITLKWQPTTAITNTLKLSGSYSKVNNAGWNSVPFRCPTGVSQLTGERCRRDFVTRQNNMPADIASVFPFAPDDGSLYNRYKSYAVTNTLAWELDDLTLTNVTNYNWNNNRFLVSADNQASSNGVWTTENTSYDSFSNEIRVQTGFDGPLNVMAGALYQKTKRTYAQFNLIANVEDPSQPPSTRFLGNRKTSFTDGETIAGFGQVTWEIVPTLELSGGVRYTHETKDSAFEQPYVNPFLLGIFRRSDSPDGLGVVSADQTFNDWSPEATITWKPSQGILLFGAYKTNYKSGGFSNGGINSALSADPLNDLTFGREKARGFEAGIKSTILDRQLRLNLVAFTYKYSDFQVDFFNSAVFAYQTLGADARTKGVELDFEYAPRQVDGLNLHGSVNYTRARYVEFIGPCYAGQRPDEGCVFGDASSAAPAPGAPAQFQDLRGAPLSTAPRWTAGLGVSYDTDVGSGYTFGVSADGRYSSRYLTSAFNQPESVQSAYATLDASLRFGPEDRRWQVSLIGKNLTNKFYVLGSVDGASTGSGTGTPAGIHADQIGFGALPRTVQLQLRTQF